MTDPISRVKTCRVCGQENWLEVLSFGLMPLANSYLNPAPSYEDEPRFPLDLIVCRECWLMSLRQVVDPKVLYRHYVYVSSDSRMIIQHMHRLAALTIKRFGIPSGGLVVEFGSNIGTQLEVFRDAGLRVLGIDPARNLAEIAARKGIETLPEFFTADLARCVVREYGSPRVVLGRHVFAHIDDLGGVLTGVKESLDQTGIFAVEVPYLLDLIEGNQFDTIYHEHLSYFSIGTLKRLFERYGLRLIDVERFPVHGGSIGIFAGHEDSLWETKPTVTTLLELEKRMGLATETYYRRFGERVERTRQALTQLVRQLAGENKRIAGYGAPAKGNTLLNACGLDNRQIQYVSDTTEFKQGQILPGTHIPIKTPAYAREHPPDYFLLLAWNYAKEIVEREREYVRAGGRFIVPIPEPVIVSAESVFEERFLVSSRLEFGGQLWGLDLKGLVQFNEGEILGVAFKPLVVHRDARGGLAEMFRSDELPSEFHPAMATISWTEPGAVRGPHEHPGQTNFLVFPGSQPFQLTLWDNRPSSVTYRHLVQRHMSGDRPMSVLIPAGVVHAIQNVGSALGLSLNFPNRLYRGEHRQVHDEAIRHECDAKSPFKA